MKLIKKFKQLLSGANSKTEARLEQSEMARKRTRSFEITVETDEVVLEQTANVAFTDAAPSVESMAQANKRKVQQGQANWKRRRNRNARETSGLE